MNEGPPPAGADPVDDFEEVGESRAARLRPIFGERARPALGKGVVSEAACWRTVSLTGDSRRDYASIVRRCGPPTGAAEYARPAAGVLDPVGHRRDTLLVHLRGGLCYRFFGVGDATIPALDIVIERNGALQGEDRASGPVAIIDADRAWCMDSGGEYRFVIELVGDGRGRYVFGIWARPAA